MFFLLVIHFHFWSNPVLILVFFFLLLLFALCSYLPTFSFQFYSCSSRCCWSCSCSFPWSVCCSFGVPNVHFFCFCTFLFISSLDPFFTSLSYLVFFLFFLAPVVALVIFLLYSFFPFLFSCFFSYSSFSPSWYYCCSCSCVVPKCSWLSYLPLVTLLFLLIALVISFSTSSSTFLSFFRLILSSLGSNQFWGEMGAQRDNEIWMATNEFGSFSSDEEEEKNRSRKDSRP